MARPSGGSQLLYPIYIIATASYVAAMAEYGTRYHTRAGNLLYLASLTPPMLARTTPFSVGLCVSATKKKNLGSHGFTAHRAGWRSMVRSVSSTAYAPM